MSTRWRFSFMSSISLLDVAIQQMVERTGAGLGWCRTSQVQDFVEYVETGARLRWICGNSNELQASTSKQEIFSVCSAPHNWTNKIGFSHSYEDQWRIWWVDIFFISFEELSRIWKKGGLCWGHIFHLFIWVKNCWWKNIFKLRNLLSGANLREKWVWPNASHCSWNARG